MSVHNKMLLAAVLLAAYSISATAQHSAGAVPGHLVPTGEVPVDTDGTQAVNPAVRSWNSQNGPYFTIFDSTVPGILPNVAAFPGDGSFIGAGEFVNGLSYMVDGSNNVYEVDDAGVIQNSYAATPPPQGSYSGMALDPTTGNVYISSTDVSTSSICEFDVLTGVATSCNTIVGSAGHIALSFDGAGNAFGYDIVTDSFMQIDPDSGATSNAVALPFDANFGQGMAYDPISGLIYILGFNNNTFLAELWTVDTSTPAAPVFNFDGVLGSTSPGGLNQLSWGGMDVGGQAPPEFARFFVSKDFDDNNTAEVEVTLSCNTGLPLEQTTTIAENDPVNFVVGDFEQGTLDCEVTEVVPVGYTASYDDGDAGVGDPAVSCAWENLEGGQYVCAITNTLDTVEIEVTKVWIDENEQFNAQNIAGATWTCSNISDTCEGSDGCNTSGFLNFNGNPDTESFFVLPDWDEGTTCSITEVDLFESGIEVDDSDCQGLLVFPGGGASCTIFNTRLFEGIPTLSQYGLGILALLMLGVGFVAFRRMV